MLKFKYDKKNDKFVATRESIIGTFNDTFRKESIYSFCDNTLYRLMRLDFINKKAAAQKSTDLFTMSEVSFEEYQKAEMSFETIDNKMRLFDRLIDTGKVNINLEVNDFEKGLAYAMFPRLFGNDEWFPEWWEPVYMSFKRFVLKRAAAEKETKEIQKSFLELKNVMFILANEAGLTIPKVTAKECNAFFSTIAEKLNVSASKEGKQVNVTCLSCQNSYNAFCLWLFHYGHNAER